MPSKLRTQCQLISVQHGAFMSSFPVQRCVIFLDDTGSHELKTLDRSAQREHNYIYTMKPTTPSDQTKIKALRQHGALHPQPEAVRDEAFQGEEFLDARDRVQVKYEMLRRHRLEGRPVSEVAQRFGVSRQAFYVAETAFEKEGLPGLIPRRRGPKRAHKCTAEVLDFAESWRQSGPHEQSVAEAVEQRFGIQIHPRSIDRALARRKKKPPQKEKQ